jgi:hypothetical protein
MADTKPQVTPVWRNQCVTYVCFAHFPVSIAHFAKAIILCHSFNLQREWNSTWKNDCWYHNATEVKKQITSKIKTNKIEIWQYWTLKNVISRLSEQVQYLCDNILPVTNLKQPNIINWTWERTAEWWCHFVLWFWHLSGETWSCTLYSNFELVLHHYYWQDNIKIYQFPAACDSMITTENVLKVNCLRTWRDKHKSADYIMI